MLRNLYFPSWTNDGDELSWNSNHASLNSCVVKFLMPISSHIWLPSLNLARGSSLNDADFVTLNLQILRLLDFWRRFVGRQALTGVEKVMNSRTYSSFFCATRRLTDLWREPKDSCTGLMKPSKFRLRSPHNTAWLTHYPLLRARIRCQG